MSSRRKTKQFKGMARDRHSRRVLIYPENMIFLDSSKEQNKKKNRSTLQTAVPKPGHLTEGGESGTPRFPSSLETHIGKAEKSILTSWKQVRKNRNRRTNFSSVLAAPGPYQGIIYLGGIRVLHLTVGLGYAPCGTHTCNIAPPTDPEE